MTYNFHLSISSFYYRKSWLKCIALLLFLIQSENFYEEKSRAVRTTRRFSAG